MDGAYCPKCGTAEEARFSRSQWRHGGSRYCRSCDTLRRRNVRGSLPAGSLELAAYLRDANAGRVLRQYRRQQPDLTYAQTHRRQRAPWLGSKWLEGDAHEA